MPRMQSIKIMEGRGYVPTFRSGETNRCPGCGRSHWHVGRLLAECAFCETALPFDPTTTRIDHDQ